MGSRADFFESIKFDPNLQAGKGENAGTQPKPQLGRGTSAGKQPKPQSGRETSAGTQPKPQSGRAEAIKGAALGVLGTCVVLGGGMKLQEWLNEPCGDPYRKEHIVATTIAQAEGYGEKGYVGRIAEIKGKLATYPGTDEVRGLTGEIVTVGLETLKGEMGDLIDCDIEDIVIHAEKSGNYVEVGGEVIYYVSGELNDVINDISNMQRIYYEVLYGNRTKEDEYELYAYEQYFINEIDKSAAGEMTIDGNGNMVMSFMTIDEYHAAQEAQKAQKAQEEVR